MRGIRTGHRADQLPSRCCSRCFYARSLSITLPIIQGANARVGGSLHRASSQPLCAAFAPARAGVCSRCFYARSLSITLPIIIIRLLGAEPNCRSDCGGGSTQGKVRTPASAAVFTEPHRSPYARHSHRHAPASAVVIAASATRSPSCRSVTIPMLLAVLLRSFALDYSSFTLVRSLSLARLDSNGGEHRADTGQRVRRAAGHLSDDRGSL